MPPAGGGVAPLRPGEDRPVRELGEMRSEGAETWLLESGLKQTELFMEPKWFRGPEGGWVEVDPKLEVVADAKDGSVAAAGVGFSARFGVSGQGVSLGFEGRELRFVPRGRGDVVPEIDGKDSTVLWYRGIAPGVDLRYRVTATGLKEDFVVATAEGFADPAVFVELPGFRRHVVVTDQAARLAA